MTYNSATNRKIISVFFGLFLKVLLIILAFPVSAQLNNYPLYRTNEIKPEYAKNLRFGIRSLGFVKNNEYSNDIADGYTLFGYQLNPTLSYQPSANFKLEGGVFLHKDFGNNKYKEIQPTLTFTYAKNRHRLIFGTLEGPLNHCYIEPLWDFENALTDPLQNGFQYQYNSYSDRLRLNTWVDWQNMIYDFDSEQEEIAAGLTGEVLVWKQQEEFTKSKARREAFNSDITQRPPIILRDSLHPERGYKEIIREDISAQGYHKYALVLPIQATVKHWGGQIDLNPNPVVTLVNGATGFEFYRNFEALYTKSDSVKDQTEIFYQLYTKNYLVGYSGDAPLTQNPFDSGYGIYLNAGANTRYGEVLLSYWNGDGYISEFGGKLYQSASTTVKNPAYTEEKRKVLILRLMRDFKLAEDVTLSARIEPIYDFKTDPLEFSTGLYLVFNSDFFITKLKKQPGEK